MDDIYKNIEEYSPNKSWKILIVFDDMTPDMLSNKQISLVFITNLILLFQKTLD